MSIRATAIGTTSDSSSVSVVIPAATQGQDTIVLFAMGAHLPSTPAGWVQLERASGTEVSHLIATKTASGTAGSTSPDAGTTVMVSMSGSFEAFAGLAVHAGRQRLLGVSSTYSNMSNAATESTVSSDAAEVLTYFAVSRTNQASTTVSTSRGSASQNATTPYFGAVLAHEVGNVGATSVTATASNPGTGSYGTAISAVCARPVTTLAGWEAAVAFDSPLAVWLLGEGYGEVAWDSVGSGGGAGTYGGSPSLAQPGLLVGDADTSITLDGSTQYAMVPQGAWQNASAYTVEAWIQATSLAHMSIIVYQGSSATGSGRRFQLRVTTDGRLEASVIIGTAVYVASSAAATIALNTTYHVAFTHDGTTLRAFCNGASVASVSAVGATNTTTVVDPLYIGKFISSGFEWAGRLEKIALYGTALPQADLEAHYAAGADVRVPTRLAAVSAEVAGLPRVPTRLAALSAEVAGLPRVPTRLAAVSAEVAVLPHAQARLAGISAEILAKAADVTYALAMSTVALGATALTSATWGTSSIWVYLQRATATLAATPVAYTLVDDETVTALTWAAVSVEAQPMVMVLGSNSRPGEVFGNPIVLTGLSGATSVEVAAPDWRQYLAFDGTTSASVTLLAASTAWFQILELDTAQNTIKYYSADSGHQIAIEFPTTMGSRMLFRLESGTQATLTWTTEQLTPTLAVGLDRTEVLRTPASVTVSVGGATSAELVTIEIVGVTSMSFVADTGGRVESATFPIPAMAAGTYTVRATDLTSGATGMATLRVAEDPSEVTTPAPPSGYPDGTDQGATVKRWVLHDQAPGGLGRYVVPINPEKMTSPHAPRVISVDHTTARAGQHIVWEGSLRGHQWSFSGTVMTQEHYETLVAFAALQRRFWLVDHRDRAWVVAFQSIDLQPVGHPPKDWVWAYTIAATIFAGPVTPP